MKDLKHRTTVGRKKNSSQEVRNQADKKTQEYQFYVFISNSWEILSFNFDYYLKALVWMNSKAGLPSDKNHFVSVLLLYKELLEIN